MPTTLHDGGSREESLVFVNNAMSARMAAAALDREGLPLDRVTLVLLRDLFPDWAQHCREVWRYPRQGLAARPLRIAWFYVRNAARLRRRLGHEPPAAVFLVNNDNLFTAHVLESVRTGRLRARVAVLVEGLMNFQDIRLRNREGWRTAVKRLGGNVLGLAWRPPEGHLSGAFDPVVGAVYSFTAQGLKAPTHLIRTVPFNATESRLRPRPNEALLLLGGLRLWMSDREYGRFAATFADWLKKQAYRKLLVKRHPNVQDPLLESLLPPYEVLSWTGGVEAHADEIPAGVVIGACCTAVATIKLLRPDLRCIDWGADVYTHLAYYGDSGATNLFESIGVELVDGNLPMETTGATRTLGDNRENT